MKAYVLAGQYRTDWNSRTNADDIKQNGSEDWSTLPWNHDDIELDRQETIYLYGGRSALVRGIQALPQDPINYRIGSRENAILLRGTLKVGKTGKTKQILAIRRKPVGGVAVFRQNLVQVQGADDFRWINLSDLAALIDALPKR